MWHLIVGGIGGFIGLAFLGALSGATESRKQEKEATFAEMIRRADEAKINAALSKQAARERAEAMLEDLEKNLHQAAQTRNRIHKNSIALLQKKLARTRNKRERQLLEQMIDRLSDID
mgnify:CR=1 FL=1